MAPDIFLVAEKAIRESGLLSLKGTNGDLCISRPNRAARLVAGLWLPEMSISERAHVSPSSAEPIVQNLDQSNLQRTKRANPETSLLAESNLVSKRNEYPKGTVKNQRSSGWVCPQLAFSFPSVQPNQKSSTGEAANPRKTLPSSDDHFQRETLFLHVAHLGTSLEG